MINHFFLSESEHNERLVKILAAKVFNREIDERTAIRIAKDMWRSNPCRIFPNDKDRDRFNSLWANSLLKLSAVNEPVV
jgi:hypothetical protein